MKLSSAPQSAPIKLVIAAILLFATAPSLASVDGSWTRQGETLRLGRFDGTIEHPDGRLLTGPRPEELARPETALVWDLAVAEDSVYAATGDGLGLLKLRGGLGPETTAALEGEPETLAVLPGPAGTLYVATGPSGAVYAVETTGGAVREIYRPEAAYIWDLALLPDGEVVIATGLPGTVARVDPSDPASASVLWRTSEPHVRSLAVGEDGRLLAGTVGSGWLVEIDARGGSGFVLFDSERAETVGVAIDAAGTVWAAFSGARTEKPANGAAEESAERGPGVSHVTVRASGKRDENEEEKENGRKDSRRESAQRPSTAGGGIVVRIAEGSEPQTVWSDGRETPMALATHPEGGALFGGALPARVWWIDDSGRAGLWYTVEDAQAVSALSRAGRTIALAASNPAKVVSFGEGPALRPTWTSDVLDAGVRARFGAVHAVTAERSVTVEARAGNTARPTDGWTDWVRVAGAAAPPDGAGGAAKLPLARYMQVRIGPADDGGVDRIDVRYRGVNRAPELRSVAVLPPGVALRPIPPAAVTSGQSPVIDRSIPDESGTNGPGGDRWRSKSAYEPGALTLRWSATDPDDDELSFDVEACRETGAPCEAWSKIAEDLDRDFHSFDSRMLADGVYRFRVRVEDDGSNFPGEVLEALGLSEPIVIDHTPPQIVSVELLRADGRLSVEARDERGRLARAEMSARPDRWVSLAPADGVVDGAEERFVGSVAPEDRGEPVTVRVTDAAGNVSLARVAAR
jgi:hypothetical protein